MKAIGTGLKAAAAIFLMAVTGLLIYGRSYYFASPAKKARLPLRPILRQSGTVGHFLGFLGLLFIVLLLAYSLRKRLRFMRNWGALNVWLEVHIFLGLAGPLLILFHAGFKFSGIVGLSAWSMILVVASGVVGRYFYRMIPRSLSGMELSRIEMEAEEIQMTFEIRKILPPDHPFWDILAGLDQHRGTGPGSGSTFLPGQTNRLRNRLDKAFKKERTLGARQRKKLVKMIVARQKLLRRAQLLEKTMKILHYWHLLHIPFVILMFLILLVHVYVTWTMGYRWIL